MDKSKTMLVIPSHDTWDLVIGSRIVATVRYSVSEAEALARKLAALYNASQEPG